MQSDNKEIIEASNMYTSFKKIISFIDFRKYCQNIVSILNDPDIVEIQNKMNHQNSQARQVISYKVSYKVLKKKFAKEHDCEYLEIQYAFKKEQQRTLVKINFVYSIAYQIPLFLFMPYHVQTDSKITKQIENQEKLQQKQKNEHFEEQIELKPFLKSQVSQILNFQICSEKLLPERDQTGVFIVQNSINKEYFYSLHHCQINTEEMCIQQLIPYYLGLIGSHPQIILQQK